MFVLWRGVSSCLVDGGENIEVSVFVVKLGGYIFVVALSCSAADGHGGPGEDKARFVFCTSRLPPPQFHQMAILS